MKKVLQQKSSQQSGVQSSEKNSFTNQLNLRLFQQLKLFPLFSLSQNVLRELVLSYKKTNEKTFSGTNLRKTGKQKLKFVLVKITNYVNYELKSVGNVKSCQTKLLRFKVVTLFFKQSRKKVC